MMLENRPMSEAWTLAAGNPCLTAASTTLKRPAQALKNGPSSRGKPHDLLGDVVAGAARDDTEEDGVGLNHLGWSSRKEMRLLGA